MQSVYFGLRTAVGAMLPDDCGPVTRAKQSALLFDRLLFEAGTLMLALDGPAVVERWLRPLAPGASAQRDWEIITRDERQGPVLSFNALVDALRVMDVGWAGVVVPPLEELALVPATATTHPTQASDWMATALERDLGIADRLDATLAPTPFFTRLMLPEDCPAPTVRAVVSPDLSELPWEDIVPLRDHGSVRAARRLMSEILALAKPGDPEAMLSTMNVLAEDIEALLCDAIEPHRRPVSRWIVTRVAVPPETMSTRAEPVVIVDAHDVGPA